MSIKFFKTAGIVLAVLFTICLLYAAYVFLSYERIEDNQKIVIDVKGNPVTDFLKTNTTYTALTYNIGFGAYSADYSFFMDGGEHSRAYNKQAVLDNIKGDICLISSQNVDFLLLQEVDLDSTRSYGVNQYEMLCNAADNISSIHAINYNSAYLMYPILEPHGRSKSGITTISDYLMTDAIRRSLPIDTSVYKLIDLDRCYTRVTVPVENGKFLCIYNVHLSAYTKDESIVVNQIKMLSEDMQADYEAGNYIVCGGDFNQDLLGDAPAVFGTPVLEENWAVAFPKDLLPAGISIAYDSLSKDKIKKLIPSCRNADIPYDKALSFVTMVDGFLLSDNVTQVQIKVIDNGFLYSDHNPVRLEFKLN